MTALAERLLAPADFARSALLRIFGRLLRPLLAHRTLRVAVLGAVGVAVPFLLTCVAPLWLLALGPLVFGVPHLVADVRYLVARPRLHQRGHLAVCVVPMLATWLLPRFYVGFVACLGVLVVAHTPLRRRLVGLVAWSTLFIAAVRAGPLADVVFAHVHNLVALALWWTWPPTRATRRWGRVPGVALFAVGAALIFGGATEHVALGLGALDAPRTGLDLGVLCNTLAPVSSPALALRATLFFAFAQSVHYGVWLRLVPDEDRPREGTRSFVSSYRALEADVGKRLVGGAAVMALGLIAWGLVDLERARDGYFAFALFHGHLELAVGLLWVLEGRR